MERFMLIWQFVIGAFMVAFWLVGAAGWIILEYLNEKANRN